MQSKFFIIAVIVSFIASVLADVDLTAPKSGSSFSASGGSAEVKISWKDDSDSDDPLSLDNANAFTILVCYYEGSDIECLSDDPIVSAKKITDKSYTAKIDKALVPNGYYYFQIYVKFDEGTSIHYSPLFKLSGMSGPSSIKASSSGDPPSAQTSLDDAATSINSKSFSVSYTLQTGKTRYAPMQLQPGTTITHSKYSRRYPTSSYTPYSTLAKTPNVRSTITPGWSYTPKSARNTAATAAYPSSFYAASSRVSKATLSSASKSKRWLD